MLFSWTTNLLLPFLLQEGRRLKMSFNNDPVAIPMIERNPNDLPEMDTSDPKTLNGEAVLSFYNISYQETVHCDSLFCKKPHVIERLSNIRYVHKLETTTLNNFSTNTDFLCCQ